MKSEPVCVFVNRTLDSSDSEQPAIANEIPTKRYLSPSASPSPLPRIPSLFSILNTQSTANRRVKVCPICGEQNFSRLSHHLTVAHNLNREESLTLLAYADRTNNNSSNNQSSIPLVSSSSPKHLDRSPQQTPISINTNNQQIPSTGFSPLGIDGDLNSHTVTVIPSSSPREQQLSNHSPRDGKKRLLCPRCDTWVLNLTDHLIKKHHLVSKQERLPYLRLARSRATENNAVKLTTNHSLATGANDSPTPPVANKDYQNIVQKYRKQLLNSVPAPSSSLPTHETAPSTSPPKVTLTSKGANLNKDVRPPTLVTHPALSRSRSQGRRAPEVRTASVGFPPAVRRDRGNAELADATNGIAAAKFRLHRRRVERHEERNRRFDLLRAHARPPSRSRSQSDSPKLVELLSC